MTLLGFYLGLHDSNICALTNGRLRYRKYERRSGVKHEKVTIEAIRTTCDEWGVHPECIAFTDGNRNDLGSCRVGELFRESDIKIGFPRPHRTFCIDHHFAHILSAWPCNDGDAPTTGIALDGRGDNNLRAQVIQMNSGVDAQTIFHSRNLRIGRFFTHVGHRLGLGGHDVDLAGKVMGLQAYGVPDIEFVENHVHDDIDCLPARLFTDIHWRGLLPEAERAFFNISSSSFLDWLASCHTLLCRKLVSFFSRFSSPSEIMIYSGGCAQNTVFNRVLLDCFPLLTIPPHCYDGGLSLGCLEFLRRYLQIPRICMPSFPFVQEDESIPTPSKNTIEKVASIIARGGVVGWMLGHGEVGPRALGHRSILFDPRVHEAKSILNSRVKFREVWRPYAASVLEEEAGKWFCTNRKSPYMLETVTVNPDCQEEIPGVTHKDGTCRIQTVSSSVEAAPFYSLIQEFYKISGVPLLLNTSLNSAGQPILGSGRQAKLLLESGQLDALCVGSSVLEKG